MRINDYVPQYAFVQRGTLHLSHGTCREESKPLGLRYT